MFLCRRLLSLAHLRKRTFFIPVLRESSPNVIHIRTLASSKVAARNSPLEGVEQATTTTKTQDLAIREFLSGFSNDLGGRSPEPIYKGPTGHLSICDAYFELRRRDTTLVANLPPATYACVIRKTFAQERYALMDHVVQDILQLYDCDDSQRACMLRDIFSTTNFAVLQRATILSMLHVLEASAEGLEVLPKPTVTNLVRMMIEDSGSDTTGEHLLQFILKFLPSHIRFYRVPNGAKALVYHPPPLIHATFRLLQKIIPNSQQQAFNLFQVLVKTGQVPHEATQSANSSEHDFNTILYTALTKASLHWSWRKLAALFLSDILSSSAPNDLKTNLTIDAIYSFLDTPNGQDVDACVELIQQAHTVSPVPNGLIRQFYTGAMKVGNWTAAEKMYEFTREPEVLSSYRYSPPQGSSLTWLMEYLFKYSRRDYLVRKLGEEVLEQNLPVPLQARASFISVVASKGHSRLARALWERYSIGKDGYIVLGDSALMIRMVSLFTNVTRRLNQEIRDVTAFPDAGSPVDVEDMSKRLEDMQSFINDIMHRYLGIHAPMAIASHEVLTSFARACFIVGKFTEGFTLLKVLLDRKEVPDLYDVNVALSAMAEQRPRSAAMFVARMIQKGLRPDVVTYGTIMHHALTHKDSVLVEKMIGLVQCLKDPKDQLKAASMLVRATVENEESGSNVKDAAALEGARSERLEAALKIIQSAVESSSISSPQTGKYLVRVSLQSGYPIMAYKFWYLLLKDSTDWEDREHCGLRFGIANSLRRDFKDGPPSAALKKMLSQLKEK